MTFTDRPTIALRVEDMPITKIPPTCISCRGPANKILVRNWADIGGPQQKVPYCEPCVDRVLRAAGLRVDRPTSLVDMA